MWPTFVRLAALGGAMLLLAPLGESFWWALELPVHFPLQLAGGALVVLLVAAALREKASALVLAVVLATALFQAREHLPRFATAEASAADVVVVALNLDWRNPDLAAATEWLRRMRADLVVLPEYTPEAARRLAGLTDIYPHRLEAPAEGAWGIGLLSRHPLVSGRVIYPGGAGTPVLDATVAVDGTALRVLGVHPRSPLSAGYTAERDAQLEALAALVAADTKTTLVCGDLNDTPFSAGFRALLARSGLVNASIGQGYPATFPTGWLPVWVPIDHCLYRGALSPVRVRSGPDVGSDHYPLVAEFRRGG